MKKSIGFLIFILLLTTACVREEQVLDIKFSRDDKTFIGTTTLAKDLEKEFKVKPKSPKVLLVETPSLTSIEYEKQVLALIEFGKEAEKYEILFVVVCPEEIYSKGYHTTVEAAKGLSTEGKTVFRVRLLNPSGVILKDSPHPVSSAILTNWLDTISTEKN